MAKVIGPALSLEAHKTLGKVLTFQTSRAGSKVYLKSKPGARVLYTPTEAQLIQRAIIKSKVEAWQNFTDEEKLLYDGIAKSIEYPGTGYHYFIAKGITDQSEIAFLLTEDGDYLITEAGEYLII